MIQHIYLIRHGHPQQGTGIPYDRVPGPPLSEIGREEARTAGLYLLNCGIERLYCSPLDRASQTARLIGGVIGIEPVVAEQLAEHRKEETLEQVRARVYSFFAAIQEGEAQKVAFVTHGSPVRTLLMDLSQDKLDQSKYAFPNGNLSPTAGVWSGRRAGDQAGQAWELDLVFKPIVVAPVGHVAV